MYLKDPVTKKLSVSLTLMIASFITVLGFSVATALELAKDPGSLQELFFACAALYFGRRVNINNKIFSSQKEESK